MVRILLVEDDPTVRETVSDYLDRNGYQVTAVEDGSSAVQRHVESPAQLVLLDLMLPGIDGYEVARVLRAADPALPIIMVTARGQEHERVHGLESGADDYLTKPFSLRELDLRIRSVLRRATAGPTASTRLADRDLTIDPATRTVIRAGSELAFTAREFDLLLWFVSHSGVVWSREELLREVWDWSFGDESTVTVHVRRLREKVETDPGRPVRLRTVFGRGYRWDPAA